MADYVENYATRFSLPVRCSTEVDRLHREADRFVATSGDRRFEAKNVVVATGGFQSPRVPTFATELKPNIVQLHSSQYRGPAQLPLGDVLVVSAANSGADTLRSSFHEHGGHGSPAGIPVVSQSGREPCGTAS